MIPLDYVSTDIDVPNIQSSNPSSISFANFKTDDVSLATQEQDEVYAPPETQMLHARRSQDVSWRTILGRSEKETEGVATDANQCRNQEQEQSGPSSSIISSSVKSPSILSYVDVETENQGSQPDMVSAGANQGGDENIDG